MENIILKLSLKQRNQQIGYAKDNKKKKKNEIEYDKPVKHSKTHYTNAL